MQATFSNYASIAYGVPFGIFAFLFMIMTIVNKRANAFIIDNVLGVKQKSNESSTTDIPSQKTPDSVSDKNLSAWSLEKHVETFLYIEQPDTEQTQALPCILRFFCDFFSAAILTVLLEIIFEKCILANTSLDVGDQCPDWSADCFGQQNGTGTHAVGPFQCTKGQNATFPVTTRLACFGWVYDDMTTDTVLNAIGVSGGLLGLIAGIVPLVYNVSYFRKQRWWISMICCLLPLSTIAAFCLVIWKTYPEAVTVLTIITFSLLITMTCGGWLWAVYQSWSKWRNYEGKCLHYILTCCKTCCCCCSPQRYKKCCSPLGRCFSCCFRCCSKPYKNYPCCCVRSGV